jgi:hypothetical protein
VAGKAGEMLAEMELLAEELQEATGGNTIKLAHGDFLTLPGLADLGITKMQSRWRSVANEAPPPIDQNDARATVISCGIDRCG